MADAKTCPTCGAQLAADAPGGACPKCLLAAGFATGTGGAPAADLRVPTPEELAPHFPNLSIERLLGRGGMGVVYKARHKALDRDVALKVLPASVASDPAFAERFQREARALAKLQHVNIVLVHDFGVTDGLFWLVMEYVDGTNIRQAMKAGQVGPQQALAIVPQICDALQYAHERGVVHRDIKPENVLLDKAGRVKVADFGLAKMMEQGATDHTLTGAGQVMGTPHYMAPEQWERPKEVDHRADIYSLGVVFYEMLTGELPVGRFAAPSKKSDVDARIDEIVLKTLEREREARYQRAEQVKTDVGRATSAAASAAAADPGPTIEAAVQGLVGNVAKVVEGASKRVAAAAVDVPPPPVRGRWHWDSAEERARGGRLSKMAVAGALAVPAMFVLILLAVLATKAFGGIVSIGPGEMFGFGVVILVGWIVSVIAWVRIQSSGDRLRGRAWAATGTFLPFVLCCVGAPVVWVLTGTRAPEPPAGAPDPAPASGSMKSNVPAPLVPADAGLRELLADLTKLGDDRSWRRVRGFYTNWNNHIALARDDDPDVAARGAAGELGLPLTTDATLGAPLRSFAVRTVEESADRTRARVVLGAPARTVEFGLACENGQWRFPPEAVLIRGGDEGAPGAFAFRLSSKVPAVDGAAETPKILDLWKRLTETVSRKNIDAAYALYLPSDEAELRAIPRADIAKQVRGDGSQGGQVGLPFFALLSDAAETLATYRLTGATVVDIVSAPDGMAIVRVSAWAGGPAGKLHFHLRGRFVDDASGRRIEWFFDRGHVNKLP